MKGGIPAQNVKSSVELTTRISVLGDLELKWRSAGCVPLCLYIHVTSPRQGVDETFPRLSWVYPLTLGSFRYDSAPSRLRRHSKWQQMTQRKRYSLQTARSE